jgi:DNA repair protein RadD
MPAEFELRDYQVESVERLRQGIREGHRSQLLCAPTGSGKTIIAAFLMSEANKKFSRVGFVVDRVNLVDQASAVLSDYGIDHGVIQAGHWRWMPAERIQVCSAQTLEKRGFFPGLNLLIVDEAHCVRKQTAQMIKARDDIRVLGLSATPFTKGLKELYTNIVNVTTTDKLVEEGHLVPIKMYAAKAIDMAGAKVVAGEWAERDIEERGMKIVGDVVGEWIDKTTKHYGGPVKTIAFSATVDHGEELCKRFNEAGFNFQQISYKDANEERRRELIAEFRKPDSEIHGLVSCEVFTKGFDVPDIRCGISARPYRKSFSSHIQQLGRVMRTFPGKQDALWLCHSGNLVGFADDMFDLFANGVGGLDDGKRDQKVRKEPTAREKEAFACSCGFMLPSGALRCPSCGKERPSRLALVETVDGEMVALNHGTKASKDEKQATYAQLRHIAKDRGYKEGWAAHKFKERFGVWPRGLDDIEIQPTQALMNWVRSRQIAYAKAKR